MPWTPEQIITALSIVAGLFGSALLTVGGWLVVSKLNKANTEKAKAETVAIYQSMLNESAEHESHLVDRIYALERDTEKLKSLLFEKTQENSLLSEQIDALKKQSDEQANKIIDLQSEIDTLRMKRK